MKYHLFFSICALVLATNIASGTEAQAEYASSADSVRPLQVGARAVDARVSRVTGEHAQLNEIMGTTPTLLVFYRGGW